MSYDKVLLTPAQALGLLHSEGEYVHTFVGGGFCFIGCDWSREEATRAITEATERELSGSVARGMRHGLCIWHNGKAVFVETDKAKLDAFDAPEAA